MNPDEIVLNFNPGTLVILNVVLGLIMLGVALDVTVDDVKVVARRPRPMIIAIVGPTAVGKSDLAIELAERIGAAGPEGHAHRVRARTPSAPLSRATRAPARRPSAGPRAGPSRPWPGRTSRPFRR